MPENEFRLHVDTIPVQAQGSRWERGERCLIMRGERCFMEILPGDITKGEVEQLVKAMNAFGGIPSVKVEA